MSKRLNRLELFVVWGRKARICFSILLFLLVGVTGGAQFKYGSNSGSITITGYTGSGSEVTIPTTIAGLPVAAIGSAAFSNKYLTGVTIFDSVANIGSQAFYSCRTLTNVVLGAGVIAIGQQAFSFCKMLRTIAAWTASQVHAQSTNVPLGPNHKWRWERFSAHKRGVVGRWANL